MKTASKAVFIDRDDTINRDVPYCSRPEDFELLPNAGDGIRLLNEDGFKVVVVTNQSGIARGHFSIETLAQIHRKMRDELAKNGASIDAIYYCPHHPGDNCECRKPKTAMILQAARDLDIDLSVSYVIGNSEADIEMGKRAGCLTVLTTISGKNDDSTHRISPDFVAPNLQEAARWVISRAKLENA